MNSSQIHRCSRTISARQQVVGGLILSLLASGGVLLLRFGALPPNFSPVGSLGFFGSAWQLALVTLGFDALTGANYAGIWTTYLGFAGYLLLGQIAKRRFAPSHWRTLALLPLASFWFFLVSNLGVWWFWYERSGAGLLLCYVNALPFYPATLLGDMVFGSSWWWLRRYSSLGRQLMSRLVYLKSL